MDECTNSNCDFCHPENGGDFCCECAEVIQERHEEESGISEGIASNVPDDCSEWVWKADGWEEVR